MAPKGVWQFQRNGRKSSVKISGSFETDDMEAVRAAVVAGLGIGLVPVHMAGAELREGKLVSLLPRYRFGHESGIYLVYLPNRTLPSRVRVLIDFLVDRFSTTPSWEAAASESSPMPKRSASRQRAA